MSSSNFNQVEAPPGGYNFAGGSSNAPAPSTGTLEEARETPRVPPNTASSMTKDFAPQTQSNASKVERVSPMDIARQTIEAQKAEKAQKNDSDVSNRAAKKEADLVASGHMPGLAEVEKDGARVRKPGEEDAAGNRIHRKSLLGKLTHWEHTGMNG